MASTQLQLASLLILSILFIAQSTRTIEEEIGECEFIGTCRTKVDCVGPCRSLGLGPFSALCVPKAQGGNQCCCINITPTPVKD
ncbi:hypothetical protein U1Q18_040219 [Sarracenia purpurea var. burkii]